MEEEDLDLTQPLTPEAPVPVPRPEPSNPRNKRSRGWMLTINNPTEDDEDLLRNGDHEYAIYQIEKGESGTEHIQAFIYYKNPRVWPKKRYPTAHIEPARDITNCIKYCSKEETRVRGPFEFGKKPAQGERTDLTEIATRVKNGDALAKIAEDSPEMWVKYSKGLQSLSNTLKKDRTEAPTVVWLWGATDVGKSSYAFDKHGAENCYIKDGTMWWDGYSHQEAIIIDDFDGKWPFRDLLRLLDRYPYQGQVKGGYVKINSPWIYITCEFEPDFLYPAGNQLAQLTRRISEEIEVQRPNHETRERKKRVFVNEQ